VRIDLDRMPVSTEGQLWLEEQPDLAAARLSLATGGDDYQIVCALGPGSDVPPDFTVVGAFEAGQGVSVIHDGRPLAVDKLGWTHG
ncbi:MAG: thiamine-monophosphate kinase, partial [Caulobacter sp.]|nr:thiamine-monophosphate kinase [Caulobacter sp.]